MQSEAIISIPRLAVFYGFPLDTTIPQIERGFNEKINIESGYGIRMQHQKGRTWCECSRISSWNGSLALSMNGTFFCLPGPQFRCSHTLADLPHDSRGLLKGQGESRRQLYLADSSIDGICKLLLGCFVLRRIEPFDLLHGDIFMNS